MNNNTFFIVIREKDYIAFEERPNGDKWGWEFADNIELFNYDYTKKMREEYAMAMPNHHVRIRAERIKGK